MLQFRHMVCVLIFEGGLTVMNRDITVEVFHSFEEENRAEATRRSRTSIEQRLHEFATLQERRWGTDWGSRPIEKVVSYEKTDW